MKFQTKAKDFVKAVSTVLAVHDFGESNDDRQPCCLTAAEDVLTLESAKLGAYVIKRVPGKLLRKGTVGLNCKDLAAMKLSGTVTIDATKDAVKFNDGKTTYRWALDSAAEHDVKEQRANAANIKKVAKIPALVMKSGAKFATYKSEIKGDYDVQVLIDKGQFEYCGLDHISYGRYRYEDDVVQAKKKLCFVLGNSLLAKVMKEVDGPSLVVGAADDGSMVRLSADDMDLFHPTIDKAYQDATETLEGVMQDTELSCRFTVDQRELKEAIERVAPVGKKSADSMMKIEVSKKGAVRLSQASDINTAHCRMKVHEAESTDNLSIVVRAQYLKEFVKVAPSSVPLTVESWSQQFLRIYVEEKPGLIDYLAMMVDE